LLNIGDDGGRSTEVGVMAYLVLKSRFLPRAIGVLLAVDGAAYLVYSFTDILARVRG
jgi:hypothetical protein